jgi:hypothetical protein
MVDFDKLLPPGMRKRIKQLDEAQEAKRVPILATFTQERGRWNGKGYEDITKTTTTKTITMDIIDVPSEYSNTPKVLQFYGGPTGYEAYRLDDQFIGILKDLPTDDLCICGGTINAWDKCIVSRKDVLTYITKEGFVK